MIFLSSSIKTCSPLLVQCLHCPIWPVLPINISYISLILLQQRTWTRTHTKSSHSKFQVSCPLSFACFVPMISLNARLCKRSYCIDFKVEEHLTPRLTPELEDQPLCAVRNCVFSTSAGTIQTWRQSLPSANWEGTLPLWQAPQLYT
jgi:hypothetical protein